MLRRVGLIVLCGLMLLAFGCASTKIAVKTMPSDAEVKLFNYDLDLKDSFTSDKLYEVSNADDFFPEGKDTAVIGIYASKENFSPTLQRFTIRKGQTNEPNTLNMQPLSTEVSIETEPQGARAYFYTSNEDARNDYNAEKAVKFLMNQEIDKGSAGQVKSIHNFNAANKLQYVLPAWTKEENIMITTPFLGKYTKTASAFAHKHIRAIRIVKEGYIPLVAHIEIHPGKVNAFSYKLRPFHTSIKITSDPEGVEIADVRKGSSFGYLGRTPFIKNFSYEECLDRKDQFFRSGKVKLMLEAKKSGYEDEYIETQVNFGEEKSIRVSLRRTSTEITFQSDPPETHVYVQRFSQKNTLKADKSGLELVRLEHWKHLGTTPFTYYMDPSDPLTHNDLFKFSKPGFADQTERFKSGIVNYHKVLEPKGAIEHQYNKSSN